MLCRRLGLSALALLLLLSCDPGFNYQPEGWESQEEGPRWLAQFGDMELATSGILGLQGGSGVIPEFAVTNGAGGPLVLEAAELVTPEGSFTAQLPGRGEATWRTIGPGDTRRIALHWEFDRPAPEVLGREPKIVLEFQISDELRRIEVTYSRSK